MSICWAYFQIFYYKVTLFFFLITEMDIYKQTSSKTTWCENKQNIIEIPKCVL